MKFNYFLTDFQKKKVFLYERLKYFVLKTTLFHKNFIYFILKFLQFCTMKICSKIYCYPNIKIIRTLCCTNVVTKDIFTKFLRYLNFVQGYYEININALLKNK